MLTVYFDYYTINDKNVCGINIICFDTCRQLSIQNLQFPYFIFLSIIKKKLLVDIFPFLLWKFKIFSSQDNHA